jgi:hypothetical protein
MSGQPGLMVYFDAESPAILALSFVKEVSSALFAISAVKLGLIFSQIFLI